MFWVLGGFQGFCSGFISVKGLLGFRALGVLKHIGSRYQRFPGFSRFGGFKGISGFGL